MSQLSISDRAPELIEYLVDARFHTSPNAFEVVTPPNPDWRKLVQGIRVPVLLLLASRGIISIDTACELQRLNPLLWFEIIPDAGHGLPYDQSKLALRYPLSPPQCTRSNMPPLQLLDW